jgi:hypothetical protein
LDAWRFRAAADDGFGKFWRARIAEAALAAPRRLAVTVTPGVPSANEEVAIHARIRRTEFEDTPGRTRVPAIHARLIGGDGSEDVIRLWPTAEPGVFEGRFRAPSAGNYDLQVGTASGASIDEVVTVVAEAHRPSGAAGGAEGALRLIAAATGGVAVSSGNLAPLEKHLRSLPSGEVERTVRPARSMWLLIVFATFLSAEWTVRRRQGMV